MNHRIDLTKFPGVPQFDPLMLVHGEEHLSVYKQVEVDKTYEVHEEIIDLQQKGGSGSVLIMQTKIITPLDELVARIKTGFFIRGLTGHEYESQGHKVIQLTPKPQRDPDHCIDEKTSENQAFIYRLSCDLNPLHVDPDQAGGFDRPILHGLCTIGIASRSLYELYFQQ